LTVASAALRISAFMTLFVISIGALAWLVALLLRLDSIDRAALMLCVMFMNAGNYGLPAARFDPTGGILNDAFRGVTLIGDAAVSLLLIILGLQLAVMLSSMPTAVSVTILAIEFNIRPRVAREVLGGVRLCG
jgi:predicted permease